MATKKTTKKTVKKATKKVARKTTKKSSRKTSGKTSGKVNDQKKKIKSVKSKADSEAVQQELPVIKNDGQDNPKDIINDNSLGRDNRFKRQKKKQVEIPLSCSHVRTLSILLNCKKSQ